VNGEWTEDWTTIVLGFLTMATAGVFQLLYLFAKWMYDHQQVVNIIAAAFATGALMYGMWLLKQWQTKRERRLRIRIGEAMPTGTSDNYEKSLIATAFYDLLFDMVMSGKLSPKAERYYMIKVAQVFGIESLKPVKKHEGAIKARVKGTEKHPKEKLAGPTNPEASRAMGGPPTPNPEKPRTLSFLESRKKAA